MRWIDWRPWATCAEVHLANVLQISCWISECFSDFYVNRVPVKIFFSGRQLRVRTLFVDGSSFIMEMSTIQVNCGACFNTLLFCHGLSVSVHKHPSGMEKGSACLVPFGCSSGLFLFTWALIERYSIKRTGINLTKGCDSCGFGGGKQAQALWECTLISQSAAWVYCLAHSNINASKMGHLAVRKVFGDVISHAQFTHEFWTK